MSMIKEAVKSMIKKNTPSFDREYKDFMSKLYKSEEFVFASPTKRKSLVKKAKVEFKKRIKKDVGGRSYMSSIDSI